MKIVLMSHFGLAEGLKSTLSYFNPVAAENIVDINAYSKDNNPGETLQRLVDSIGNERLLIFTDILGGSVNQLCVPYLARDNTYVFTGMNLAMLLQATCLNGDESEETVKALADVGKEAVVCMNDYSFDVFSEDDE